MNWYIQQISEVIDVIADAVVARQWGAIERVDIFVDSWIELTKLDQEQDSRDSDRAVALTHTILLFGLGASEDEEGTWDSFIHEAATQCASRDFFHNAKTTRETIFGSLRTLINDPSSENVKGFTVCWDKEVWENSDYSNEANGDALIVVVGTLARILGLAVMDMSSETRAIFAQELRELAVDLHEESDELDNPSDHCDASPDVSSAIEPEQGPKTSVVPAKPEWRRVSSFKKVKTNEQESEELSTRKLSIWQQIYNQILHNRAKANELHRKLQCKPYFSDSGADYLAEAVARVLCMATIPEGVSPKKWAIDNPQNVVVIDASLILGKQNPRTKRNPVSAIKGRLKSMRNYYGDTMHVGAIADIRFKGKTYRDDVATLGSAVVLFRRN